MNSRHPGQMRQTNFSTLTRKKPTSFRVIMKCKSGFLMNNVDDVKDTEPIKNKFMKTEMSMKNDEIKDYVKSMKTKTTKQFHKQALKQEDNKSSRSAGPKQNNSLSLSRAISVNQSFTERNPKPFPRLSVEQLEKRIDHLIEIKLSNTLHHKELKTQMDPIDKEIKDLVDMLREEADDDENGEKLESINRKIGILQKIMAESLTQSEMAKKSYYKFINNRKPVKPSLNKYNIDLRTLRQKVADLLNFSAPVSIHYESTSQLNYKAPDKKSYPVKPSKTAYQFRAQPMHRSSYNRDFLVYVNVPELPFREGPSQILSGHSRKANSMYQQDFTNKKIQRINFKELDCYRNKFKNLEVPFLMNSRRVTEGNVIMDPESQIEVQKKEKGIGKTVRFKTEHYSKNLSTESRMSFTGQTNKLKSSIKHKNLNDLRYAFKAAVHA